MSTLTKIFVVLLVVSSIAFSMATIAFVARTHEWRSLAEGYQQQAHASAVAAQNAMSSSVAQLASNRDFINKLSSDKSQLEEENGRAELEIAKLTSELAQARGALDSAQATNRTLSAELKVGQSGWQEQRQQRVGLEKRNISLEKRNLDLNERVNEQTSQLAVLKQYQRQLEQQIHILRQENRKFAQLHGVGAVTEEAEQVVGTGPAGAVTPLSPVASSPIRGSVTEVSGSLATISVGSADGVSENMVFVIYRGEDYLGDLKVVKVEPNQAAGSIVRAGRGTVQIGDQVADERRFGMSR